MMLTTLRRRLAPESGYSIVAVMILMMVGSLFAVAAWSAANNDIPQSQKDFNRKQSLNAAEGGLNWYLYHLNQDNQYWTYCTAVPGGGAGTPLIQPWDGTSARPFRNLPGATSKYVVELVPQNGSTQCVPGADTSMIDKTYGTLQIKATGQSQGVRRSLVGTFRRAGFLDFLYFTNFETQDPTVFTLSNPNYIGLTTPGACDKYRWATPTRPAACSEIQFANLDVINGPFHTNDSALICGSPTFGRDANDKIETGGAPAFVPNGGCGNSPQVRGTLNSASSNLAMPASNSKLATIVDPQYKFSGRKFILLTQGSGANPGSITVSDDYAGTVNVKNLPWPANGVIYVATGSANATQCQYDMQNSYNNGSGCADVYVHGTYSSGLTITSQNDVIVNGPLLRSGNGMLGLIADNFVRVWHPVNRSNCGQNVGAQPNGPPPFSSGIEIDAALMSLTHSFIVDNYDCGPPEGTLKIVGAIAQKYRGPVGTGSGGNIATGYIKNYNYDDRFRNQNPPYFLDPLQSKWQMIRFTEQIPAR